MVDYIFGNYLVECGKITKPQLFEVIKKQDEVRAKIGFIAVAEGMMTSAQADEVNRLQATMDKRFGNIAVEKGYLTEEQVLWLLDKQGNAWQTFIQTLVEEQLILLEELEWLLEGFKRENEYDDEQLEALKSDEPERIIPLLLPEGGCKYQELIGTMVRTMIRLIDRHVYLGRAAMVDELPADGASQALEGNGGFIDCLAERDGGLRRACSVFGQEEFTGFSMDMLDAAGELLNCVNGLYASARSREGQFLELMPPQYRPRRDVREDSVCRIPVFVGGKGLYFAIGER